MAIFLVNMKEANNEIRLDEDLICYTNVAHMLNSIATINLKVEMTKWPELAFNVLDTDKAGFITLSQLKMISKKLSNTEVKALMMKVFKTELLNIKIFKTHSQLDIDRDGKLSLEEFKVLFENADRRRRASEEVAMVS